MGERDEEDRSSVRNAFDVFNKSRTEGTFKIFPGRAASNEERRGCVKTRQRPRSSRHERRVAYCSLTSPSELRIGARGNEKEEEEEEEEEENQGERSRCGVGAQATSMETKEKK